MGAIGVAQPVIWTQDVPLESQPRVARDASSNLYMTTLAFTAQSVSLIGRKYDRNGTLIWTRTVDVSQSFGSGYNAGNTELVVTTNRAYAMVGTSVDDLPEVRIVAFDLNTGVDTSVASNNIDFGSALAANSTHLVIGGRKGTEVLAEYLNPNTLASIDTIPLTANGSFTSNIVLDASGNAYTAATQTGKAPLLAKVSPSGSVIWSRTFDSASYTNEFVMDVDVDTGQNRLFVVGHGKDGVTEIPLVGAYSSTTGGLVSLANRSGSSSSRSVDVVARKGGGAYVLEGFGSYRMLRVSSSGSLTWLSSAFTANNVASGRIEFDLDGDLVLTHGSGSTSVVVRAISVDSGSLLRAFSYTRPSGSSLRGAVIDSAGSSYVALDLGTSSRLQRVQAAELTLPTLPSTGGFPATGRVRLATAAVSPQLWQLSSSNTSIATVPPSIQINTSSMTSTFTITTLPITANTTVSIFARHGGLVLAKVLTVLAPSLQFTTVNPQVSMGGTPLTGVVQITGPAPTGGRTVALSVSKPEVATVQASVVVSAGTLVATFPLTTVGVNSNQGIVLTATLGAVIKTYFFAVNAPSLVSIAGTPSLVGGTTGTLTLNIDGIAPPGGRSILLFSGAPGVVILPSSFAVPEGQTTVNVPMPTTAVTSSINVLVFATRSGIHKTTTVTVTP
jgi:hypothetical protein